jgi:hypothetical protein
VTINPGPGGKGRDGAAQTTPPLKCIRSIQKSIEQFELAEYMALLLFLKKVALDVVLKIVIFDVAFKSIFRIGF